MSIALPSRFHDHHKLGRTPNIQCPIELFRDHWIKICDQKSFAHRSNFNPFHIPHLLPHIAVLQAEEVNPETGLSDFIVRLCGDEVINYHRNNYTGQRLSDIYDNKELYDRLELYNSILHEPRMEFIRNIIPYKVPQNITIDKGLFPFSSNGVTVNQLFLVEKRNLK